MVDTQQGPARRGFFSRLGSFLTTTRIFVANTLFVLFVLFVLVMVFATSAVVVPDNSALVLNPRGVLVDQRAIGDSLESLLSPGTVGREVTLNDLLEAIERAERDDRISMLLLRLDQLQAASPGHAETIGAAIQAFRDAGKQVMAYGNFFTQSQYLIASYADAVYMHPMGQILLPGYGGNQLYFKELLDKLNINVNIFRVGRYKEFIEPYTRSDMSPEARDANQALVDGLWAHYAGRIVANRDLEPGTFERYTQQFPDQLSAAGDPATAAVEHLLVDELLTPDAARSRVGNVVGYNGQGDINGIGFEDYLAATSAAPRPGERAVAVLTASGPVVTGRSRGTVAAERVIEQIRRVRRDDDIAALVLRLNTPGGSSFASELIRQELELVQLAGKPVVVSMSNVAASGGYWIASTTDRIVAEPTTITGSIGVFGLVPTFEDSLAAIGVATDGIGTTPLPRADPLAGLPPAMSEILQAGVENTYEQFLNLVARGRDMDPQRVDEIAQGRVWLGARAVELGLVDELGVLDDAVVAAAQLAELDNYQIRYFRSPLSAREMLLQQLINGDALLPPHPLGDRLQSAWRWLGLLDDPRHSYAICEGCAGLDPGSLFWW